MHIPVLKEEVVKQLGVAKDRNFIDCTAGCGGHLQAILEKNKPEGRVMAFEWDKELYKKLREKNYQRVLLKNKSYTLLQEEVESNSFYPVSGVLFDLGFSSYHVDCSKRGFSFMRDEPLDMRYSKENPLTAAEIVNTYKEKDILYILKKYGEEEFAENITKKIIEKREDKRIETTKDLADVIKEAVPNYYRNQKIDCATKTFQGLRIAVNGELLGFRSALLQALNILEDGGRIVVICFHSGESDVLKDFVKKNKVKLLTKKPILPKSVEVEENIRSRSAKLYAVEK